MELLRELLELQHQHGFLEQEHLENLARKRGVPRYRLEGLVSFYSHFRRTPPPKRHIALCRDVVCRMNGCEELRGQLDQLARSDPDLEVVEVSCLGRCDHAPAVAVNDRPATAATAAADQLLQDDTVDWLKRPDQHHWQADPYDDPSNH